MDNAPEQTASDNTPESTLASAVSPVSEGQATSWTTGLSEESLSYIGNKGWKEPAQLLESYQNLESMRGVPAEQLAVIKPDMSPEERMDVYNKLGRPESIDGYTFQAPEGDDGVITDWFKQASHDAGLTDVQAKAVFDGFSEKLAELAESQSGMTEAKHLESIEALKGEWGNSFEHNTQLAESALEFLGISEDALVKIKEAGLAGDMLRAGQKLGSMMGEGELKGMSVTDQKANMGAFTPEEAQLEIDKLMANPEFMSRYTSRDSTTSAGAAKELEKFYKIIASRR